MRDDAGWVRSQLAWSKAPFRTAIGYVPSLSNIADLPSRGKFELLERLGAQRTHIPVLGVTDWSTSLTSWIDRARDFADNG